MMFCRPKSVPTNPALPMMMRNPRRNLIGQCRILGKANEPQHLACDEQIRCEGLVRVAPGLRKVEACRRCERGELELIIFVRRLRVDALTGLAAHGHTQA